MTRRKCQTRRFGFAIFAGCVLSSSLPAQSETTPFPQTLPATTLPSPTQTEKVLPLSLDLVFRLAEEQNPQVRLAREKVRGACAEQDVAASGWLPKVLAGPAYYRHEGGIQDQDGTLVRSSTGALFGGVELYGQLNLRDYAFQQIQAEREVWRQKGELSRLTNDVLLDAATAYIDLLLARSGLRLAMDTEEQLQEILTQAESIERFLSRGQLEALRAERANQRQLPPKMYQLEEGTTAKMAYLLGLDPCARIRPLDAYLVPLNLVDATVPTKELVARALTNGPGVRELEGLLNLLHRSRTQSWATNPLMPVIEARMAEGGFGAGSGLRLDWDNRWDLGLQARWDLTGLATIRSRERVLESKMQQAHLSQQDLHGKLTAGVQESQSATLRLLEQLRATQEQIRHAKQAYLDAKDLTGRREPQTRSYTEVLQALRAWKEAEYNQLFVLAGYNKAQLRLLLLLGPAAVGMTKHEGRRTKE